MWKTPSKILMAAAAAITLATPALANARCYRAHHWYEPLSSFSVGYGFNPFPDGPYASTYGRPGFVYNQPYSPYTVTLRSADIQRELARLGYYRGNIDGVIGRRTREAIRYYQLDNGLAVTGAINQALLQSLF